jgi:NTP pyrophosphatase (non-canonical NTP hydrolase)
MMKNIIQLEAERLEWSLVTFPEATSTSSLRKLEAEIKEVEAHLEILAFDRDNEALTEEFADCLKCLFDSAGRAGILPETIFKAFEKKLIKNKSRTWIKNPDNSYSHVK